jgi:hypothetical protein
MWRRQSSGRACSTRPRPRQMRTFAPRAPMHKYTVGGSLAVGPHPRTPGGQLREAQVLNRARARPIGTDSLGWPVGDAHKGVSVALAMFWQCAASPAVSLCSWRSRRRAVDHSRSSPTPAWSGTPGRPVTFGFPRRTAHDPAVGPFGGLWRKSCSPVLNRTSARPVQEADRSLCWPPAGRCHRIQRAPCAGYAARAAHSEEAACGEKDHEHRSGRVLLPDVAGASPATRANCSRGPTDDSAFSHPEEGSS